MLTQVGEAIAPPPHAFGILDEQVIVPTEWFGNLLHGDFLGQ
jgi:hypothetical protein